MGRWPVSSRNSERLFPDLSKLVRRNIEGRNINAVRNGDQSGFGIKREVAELASDPSTRHLLARKVEAIDMRCSDSNDPAANIDEERRAVAPSLNVERRMNVAPSERRNVRSGGHMQLLHERASREFDLLRVTHSVENSGGRQAFVAHLVVPVTVRTHNNTNTQEIRRFVRAALPNEAGARNVRFGHGTVGAAQLY
jgi:hypothetical protein